MRCFCCRRLLLLKFLSVAQPTGQGTESVVLVVVAVVVGTYFNSVCKKEKLKKIAIFLFPLIFPVFYLDDEVVLETEGGRLVATKKDAMTSFMQLCLQWKQVRTRKTTEESQV